MPHAIVCIYYTTCTNIYHETWWCEVNLIICISVGGKKEYKMAQSKKGYEKWE